MTYDRFRTKLLKNINQTITNTTTILEVIGSGVIAEAEFLSSDSLAANAVYGVRIKADKKVIYNDTYAVFATRSNYEADMSAYQDAANNLYISLFRNIGYDKSFKIEVYKSTATFSSIQIKYHERVEK